LEAAWPTKKSDGQFTGSVGRDEYPTSNTENTRNIPEHKQTITIFSSNGTILKNRLRARAKIARLQTIATN